MQRWVSRVVGLKPAKDFARCLIYVISLSCFLSTAAEHIAQTLLPSGHCSVKTDTGRWLEAIGDPNTCSVAELL